MCWSMAPGNSMYINRDNLPKALPRTDSRLGRWVGRTILKLSGWQVIGQFPAQGKFVAAVAPHTSNWDFIIALGVKLSLDIKIQFLGKHTLFVGPLGWLLRKLGGIAVDRTSAHGIVAQVSNTFKEQETLIVGIAPEGTRKKSASWKSGFLYIANQSHVPVVPMALDYSRKLFVIMPCETISDDIPRELHRMKQLFPKHFAKYPTNVSD